MCLLCQLWAKEFEDLQRVSKPSTTTLKLTKATARPPDPRSSPISKFLVTSCQSSPSHHDNPARENLFIMPIVISGHMAPSSCVRTKLTRPVHSTHEDPNIERSKSPFVDPPAPTSECMQMNRCQGRKASRSVP